MLEVFEELKKKERKERRKKEGRKEGKEKEGKKGKEREEKVSGIEENNKGLYGNRVGSSWLWKAFLGFLLIAIGGQQSIFLKAVILCQKKM